MFLTKLRGCAAMTIKVSDIAPIEVQLAEIAEQLAQASADAYDAPPDLLLDAEYLDAAKSMLSVLQRFILLAEERRAKLSLIGDERDCVESFIEP
jgi:hypothetical protein